MKNGQGWWEEERKQEKVPAKMEWVEGEREERAKGIEVVREKRERLREGREGWKEGEEGRVRRREREWKKERATEKDTVAESV